MRTSDILKIKINGTIEALMVQDGESSGSKPTLAFYSDFLRTKLMVAELNHSLRPTYEEILEEYRIMRNALT